MFVYLIIGLRGQSQGLGCEVCPSSHRHWNRIWNARGELTSDVDVGWPMLFTEMVLYIDFLNGI